MKFPLVCYFVPFVCTNYTRSCTSVCYFNPLVVNDRKYSGFTLFEILITLVLVGILAGLAAPATNTLIKNQRVSNQANDFLADLNYARTEAIRRSSTRIVVCPRGMGAGINNCLAGAPFTNGWITFADANGNTSVDAGDTLLRDRPALTNNLQIRPLAASGNCAGATGASAIVFFTGRGTAVGGTGCYALCDDRGPSKGREFVVGNSGQVRIVRSVAACS